MKQVFAIIALVILLVSICACSFRTEECQVVTNNNGIVTLEDASGNIWEATEVHFTEEKVSVIFFNNFTNNNIFDDKIFEIRG